jgi:ABC-type nitrate/sulfonate/bicarbonate transport system ATPase subunit
MAVSVMRNKPSNIRILTIREQKVVLDGDLAAVDGVTTRRLNEQFVAIASDSPKTLRFSSQPMSSNL